MSDDEALRRAWRRGTSRGADPATARAPAQDPDELWAAAVGELPHDRATRVLDRAFADDDALAELRVAEVLAAAAAGAEDERHDAPHATNTRPWAVAIAIAAGLVLAWFVRPSPPRDAEAPLREAATPAITAFDTATVDRNACTLQWVPRTPGGTFELRVMTDAADVVVHARELVVPRYTVPALDLASLPAGAVLLWQVDQLLPDGSRRRSPTFSSVLR